MSSAESQRLFERERDHLVYEISQNMNKLTTNLALLNRNLQEVNALGGTMEQTADVWRTFHQQIVDTALPTSMDGTEAEEM
ncbi:hypothetical protein IWQ60_000885 [Tieghemiomyces parasiticus]|uniref:DASH complex subunit DAD1 n=1 Tax=Tieghemiomyces parasiticus TaxID=78921 RepID=A0A9W8ALL0_9FUNG|nr:hypothetical protein IWQ60_000885 [Tieghemiomyces parasiticus]